MPLLCMQVGKPGRPSGCFWRDGEYALNKATVSQLEANHVLMATLRWQSRGMRLGNIRSAYAIPIGLGCRCSPMQCLILSRCEEPHTAFVAGHDGNFPRHLPTHPWLYSDVSRVCVARTWGPFSWTCPFGQKRKIEGRCMNRMVDPSEYASHPSILSTRSKMPGPPLSPADPRTESEFGSLIRD